MIDATHHDTLVRQDYRRLMELGIRTVREGLRWHLIERSKGKYDFSSMLPLLDAAQELEMGQIIDLFHFGWPDYLDIFSPEFVDSFSQLAFEFARVLQARGVETPHIVPMNEISFISWAGGDAGYLNPFQKGRGPELKWQLVRAALQAAEVLLQELPRTRLIWPEPVIHVVGDEQKSGDKEEAEKYRLAMYEVWDMLSGRSHPELGGRPGLLQMIGANFYDRNEWINYGETLERTHPLYRPFHAILLEVWNRYRVPMFVSETGTEDGKRPEWFAYISAEVRRAIAIGIPVKGLCLYPILNHPGWDNDRHCYNGLFDYPDTHGDRSPYEPLALEIRRQQKLNSEVYTNWELCIDKQCPPERQLTSETLT